MWRKAFAHALRHCTAHSEHACPYRVTVDTGIDALTHALEALVNRNGNAHSEALALSALKLIGANLEKVADNPDDRDAREAMMLGATHAGLAVSNTSTALIHGLSRPVGAFFHVPHGMSNAMVLPLVTQFSLNSALPHYAAAARALGSAAATDSDQVSGAKLVEAFLGLNRRLKVPTPQEFGIDRSRYLDLVPEMVRQGLASGTPANNPRVPTVAEMTRLYDMYRWLYEKPGFQAKDLGDPAGLKKRRTHGLTGW